MPNVAFIRPELKQLLPSYGLIRDCIAGQETIKKKGDKYLPRPNSADVSDENRERYNAYKERAVFYNVTQKTLEGLVGQIFMRAPVVEVPAGLESVVENADGSGVSAEQTAKKLANYVVAFGRGGLLSDYPQVGIAATKAELENGFAKPTIKAYSPFDIINWRTVAIGSKKLLSLVVLHETYISSDDGFEMKESDQWRVLRLTNFGYSVEIWRKGTSQPGGATGIYQRVEGPIFPTDASGNNFEEIPFTFAGSENNDEDPDLPPMYDLAALNIAHYRNSADYEESCFMVGQPTPYFTGLTEAWVEQVLKGSIALGSRGAVPLPAGADAGLLQCEPNTMPMEAMTHKETQMVALGAKLVEQAEVQQTATQAEIQNTSEVSTLTSCAKNISTAMQKAFEWCAKFTGEEGAKLKFELSTDFDLAKLQPAERAQTIAEWQAGALAFEEMRAVLRRGGIAKLDDLKAKNMIAEEQANMVNLDDNVG